MPISFLRYLSIFGDFAEIVIFYIDKVRDKTQLDSGNHKDGLLQIILGLLLLLLHELFQFTVLVRGSGQVADD